MRSAFPHPVRRGPTYTHLTLAVLTKSSALPVWYLNRQQIPWELSGMQIPCHLDLGEVIGGWGAQPPWGPNAESTRKLEICCPESSQTTRVQNWNSPHAVSALSSLHTLTAPIPLPESNRGQGISSGGHLSSFPSLKPSLVENVDFSVNWQQTEWHPSTDPHSLHWHPSTDPRSQRRWVPRKKHIRTQETTTGVL